ncbi:MAG: UbiX family flavin prenyltransferase [Candidatus Lokiarchaeota archaeon]|nr:UbiX family flavin prenyltransferase [Candidatus Lokiarchaeota archaeon]
MLVAITGASGAILGIKFLEELKKLEVETELVISEKAEIIIKTETNYDIKEVRQLATKNYEVNDLTAAPASGSYKVDKMVVIPCSMKTLAAVANGYSDNLISRVADVMIKERRRLILVVRETPLNAIHLENMLKLTKLGVVIFPPIPSFYHKPKNVDDIINHTIGRILDQAGIEIDIKRWGD